MQPVVESFYDKATSTISHVVVEPNGRRCAIVDSVLDYEQASGRTRTDSADRIIANVRDRGLEVDWILETHAHADHLSAAQYLRRELGGRIGIGARITEVQRIFKDAFNLERTFNTDGQQFDHLFADGEVFRIGRQEARVVCTPGHTPADVTYVVGDAAFVGDTLFMPDGGTARADFPGGDAATLYRSIRRILDLPPETRLFVCHDYQPGGREPRWETTVAEQRERNIHVGGGKVEEEFVAMRAARPDAQHAHAPRPLDPDQHPRRRDAPAGGQRHGVHQGAAEQALSAVGRHPAPARSEQVEELVLCEPGLPNDGA